MRDPATTAPRSLTAALAVVLALAAAPAARAQIWNEAGDAGQLPVTAQITVGAGALTTINGYLTPDFYDSDVYCVHLTATPPTGLPLVYLNCVVIQGPNVYLFDSAGMGIATNYTCAGSQKAIVAPSTSLAPGTYYVAVSHWGWEPISSGGAIWLPSLLGQRAPDGPGAANPIIGWGGLPVPQPINPYSVGLNANYFTYCDASTPAMRPTWGSLKVMYRD
jgi:hypothetical protein